MYEHAWVCMVRPIDQYVKYVWPMRGQCHNVYWPIHTRIALSRFMPIRPIYETVTNLCATKINQHVKAFKPFDAQFLLHQMTKIMSLWTEIHFFIIESLHLIVWVSPKYWHNQITTMSLEDQQIIYLNHANSTLIVLKKIFSTVL